MSENENINATAETIEAPKKRGNPNWTKKKDEVVRASVISESRPKHDATYVENKDPTLHYHWGRKSNEEEMQDFADKQYVPARGNEKIIGNPFEASKDTTGQTKERGDRILMCCPKELFDSRQQERLGKHIGAKESVRNDARRISGSGVLVESDAEETTKRESLLEQ